MGEVQCRSFQHPLGQDSEILGNISFWKHFQVIELLEEGKFASRVGEVHLGKCCQVYVKFLRS